MKHIKTYWPGYLFIITIVLFSLFTYPKTDLKMGSNSYTKVTDSTAYNVTYLVYWSNNNDLQYKDLKERVDSILFIPCFKENILFTPCDIENWEMPLEYPHSLLLKDFYPTTKYDSILIFYSSTK